jgi:hypothetical protein
MGVRLWKVNYKKRNYKLKLSISIGNSPPFRGQGVVKNGIYESDENAYQNLA